MLKFLSLMSVVAFLILGILLGVLNSNLVEFNYYFDQVQLPLSILLSVSLALGLLIAGLFVSVSLIPLKWKLHKLSRMQKQNVNEIIELKKQLHKQSTTEKPSSVTLPIKTS